MVNLTAIPSLKTSDYATREIDDIANLAFISGRANRRISDKPPADYIPELISSNGEQAFTSQCIPLDPVNLSADRYRSFFAERRRRIAERLNAFLA